MTKIWKIKEKAGEDFFNEFKEFPRPIAQLFHNRGIKSKQEANKFLNPLQKDEHDPFLMLNMEEGAKRIARALNFGEKIAIYGDYDTDGICSAAILSISFERFGADDFDIFIPSRYKDGYGLTISRVEQIAKLGVKLIITVDCGITDVEEVKRAKELGIEVLVFDHHLPQDKVPDTLIVDTHQEKDEYPFKYLAAAGVAYKLSQALAVVLDFPFWQSLEKQLIDLVALATIADMMPMVGENRILVKRGLKQLEDSQNIGIQALLKEAGIDNIKGYNAYHIGFVLAPRLNAVGRVRHKTPEGRIENTDYSFGLVATKNEKEAQMWAKKISELNNERIKKAQEVHSQINKIIESQEEVEKILFFGDSDWDLGFLGLIAGKLKDEWHRPVFLYSRGEEISKGSVRSISNYNLVEAMEKANDILIESGGHKVAAGFSLKNENIEKFREFLKKEGEKLKEKDLIPTIEIEAEVLPEDIGPGFWQIYKQFEPFGKENEEPIFLIRDVEIGNIRLVGNGNKHLKMNIEKNGKNFNVIGFNHADKISHLQKGSRVDLIFSLKNNIWQGREYLDLNLVDIRF